MDVCNNCSLGLKREDCSKAEYKECLKLAKAKSEYFFSAGNSSYIVKDDINKEKKKKIKSIIGTKIKGAHLWVSFF